MDKQRQQLIIVGILIIIFIFAWSNAFKSMKKKSRPVSNQPAVAAAVETVKLPALEPLEATPREGVQEDNSEWGRCIFSGKSYSPVGEEINLKLSGILWDEKSPTTIIDGEVYKKGDKVGPFTIVDIQKDKVVLSDGSRNFDLNLN